MIFLKTKDFHQVAEPPTPPNGGGIPTGPLSGESAAVLA